ncbi:MAG: NAD(P)-binding protein [Deltaproteobacteria bacterium]|nr:NAD(P)-binding protein [Deltaproteobacteria bacterium]MCB9785876.1 NAD(P)-binding protein [Deltaproteobacteria bacterium]
METVKHLVVGAGVTGLAFADWLDTDDLLIFEAEREIGGYCRTVARDGFVWDYSGHFFHFRHPEIERYLVERMEGQEVRKIVKEARIWHEGALVDFPFQKNIHQLPQEQFIECLYDLFFKDEGASGAPPANFEEMLYRKFGRGIAERFLIPYNRKLYATDLRTLDVDAMGRFFPYADTADIVRNFRRAENQSYNATFTYPAGGAIQYVNALAKGIDPSRIALSEPVVAIDLARKVATTPRREVAFEHLTSAMPFPKLLAMTGVPHEPADFSYNKVLVFNLGFDRKGPEGVHWMYFASPEQVFYRLGFYDNIFGTDRMSMYVEIGYPKDARVDDEVIAEMLERTLADLEATGITSGHRLVASHHVLLDPAYVHITRRSAAEVARLQQVLAHRGVHSLGRYGAWTYCSIEDNIVEARAHADSFNALTA